MHDLGLREQATLGALTEDVLQASGIEGERQLKLLSRLLDGFEGKLTSGKWAAIAKCSADTALRDISDLLARGVLVKAAGGGRSTHYALSPVS